jgi:hypothetical protein
MNQKWFKIATMNILVRVPYKVLSTHVTCPLGLFIKHRPQYSCRPRYKGMLGWPAGPHACR